MFRRLLREFAPALALAKLTMVLNHGGSPLADTQRYTVQCNPVLLQTLFSNLLQNALEASPAGGKIVVTFNTAKPATAENDATLAIEIHNSGAIPQDIQQRFFQKYATSGKPGGTGLGTYSALLIAEAHGGGISFTSSEADGTRVLVTLPMLSE